MWKPVFAFSLFAVSLTGADTLDFERPAYRAGKKLDGQDGWAFNPNGKHSRSGDFRIHRSHGHHGNQFLRAHTHGHTQYSREVDSQSDTAELTWRWRAPNGKARLCFGPSDSLEPGKSNWNAFRVKVCFNDVDFERHPPHGHHARCGKRHENGHGGHRHGDSHGGEWIYMRLSLDIAADRYSLYRDEGKARDDEDTLVSNGSIKGSGPVSRIFLKAGGRPPYVDVDDIEWGGVGEPPLPPLVLAITSPNQDTLVNQTPITVAYMVNGNPFTRQATLTEGPNRVIVDTVDAFGRRAADTVNITLDTQPPFVQITSPAPGFVTNQTTIAVAWTVDGVAQAVQTTENLAQEGTNTITRSAMDAAGNIGSASIQVVRDTETPVVVIISPSDGFTTNQASVPVTWTVDGMEQTTQLAENLILGPNTVTRSATDAAGNTGTASITVTRTEAPGAAPVVVITSPADGFVTDQRQVTVNWTVNGAAQPAQDEKLVEGINFITRTFTDAGGTGADTIRAIRNSFPYDIRAYAQASPTNGGVPLTVTFTGWGSSPYAALQLHKWDFDGDGNVDTILSVPPDTIALRQFDFEAGLAGWEPGGASGALAIAHGGARSGGGEANRVWSTNESETYVDYMDAWIVSLPIAIPAGGASLEWRQDFDSEWGYDYGYVEIDDGGGIFFVLKDFNGTLGRSIESIDLSAYSGNTVRIRFRFLSDGSVVYPGWKIDDIRVLAYPTSEILFFDNADGSVAWEKNPSGAQWNIIDEPGGPVLGFGSQWIETDTATYLYGNDMDAWIASPKIGLPDTGAVTLAFWQYLTTADAGDGGLVEISVNDGAYALLQPLDGYPGAIDGHGPGFTGSLSASTPLFDLTPFAGDSIRIRFHFVSDAAGTGRGWLIDNIRVFQVKGGLASGISIVAHTYETPGDYQALFTVADYYGIESQADPFPMAIKVGPAGAPKVAILSPRHGTVTNQGEIPVAWTVNGVLQPNQNSETLVEDGVNVITRTAMDSAGNISSASILVMRDVQAPGIFLYWPYDGLVTNQNPIDVYGYRESGFFYRLDSLVEGENLIVVNDTDEAGNIGAVEIRVFLDTQPPVVAIVSPGDTTVIDEAIWVQYTLDGELLSQVYSLAPGLNEIVVYGYDVAGNVGTDTVRVIRLLVPYVEIQRPADGEVVYRDTIPVIWTVDGERMSSDTSAVLAEGFNVIVRCSTNEAGLTGCDTAHVRFDPNPPVVRILSPLDGSYTIRSTTIPWWWVSYAVDVVWTVDGDTQTVQTYDYIYDEGPYTIIRSFTDSTGSTGADTVYVVKDTKVPVITLINPDQSGIVVGSTVDLRWAVDSFEQTPVHHVMDTSQANMFVLHATDSAGNSDSLYAFLYSGTIVPDLLGKPHAEAESLLAQSVLGADSSWVDNDTVPTGVVFAQSPGTGNSIRFHFPVHYKISRGLDAVDLIPQTVNTDSMTVDPLTLAAGGSVRVVTGNTGRATVNDSFGIMVFEDRNRDQKYTPSTDLLLGQTLNTEPIQAGDSSVVNIAVSGSLTFNGNRIIVVVDYSNLISETHEDNNVSQSMAKCRKLPVAMDYTPQLKWGWKDSLGLGIGRVFTTPFVANLTDDNGDGKINSGDIPDVIVGTYGGYTGSGRYMVLNGKDGREIWKKDINHWSDAMPAVGDLDGDGKPEIVIVDMQNNFWERRLLILDNEGNKKDSSSFHFFGSIFFGIIEAISLADMDGDGKSEIIWGQNIHDPHGKLLYPNTFNADIRRFAVVDLDGDGYMELIGTTPTSTDINDRLSIISFKEKKVIKRSGTIPSYPIIAKLGTEPVPSVLSPASTGWDSVGGVDFFGADLQKIRSIPAQTLVVPGYGSALEDYFTDHVFYGKDSARILISLGSLIATYLDDPGHGAVIPYFSRTNLNTGAVTYKSFPFWRSEYNGSSGRGTAFDIDDDGNPEPILQIDDSLFILDSAGQILGRVESSGHIWSTGLVVSDVDKDGIADIVVGNAYPDDPNKPTIAVYSNPTWTGARGIYNQKDYTVTNVNDDGSIPRFPTPHWQANNTVNIQCTEGHYACVDVSASYPQITVNDSGRKEITARIGNGGALELIDGVPVSMYAEHLGVETLLAVLPSSKRLESGEFYTLRLALPDSMRGRFTFRIAADDSGNGNSGLDESNEANNAVTLSFLMNNQNPSLAQPENQFGEPGEDFTLAMHATDPDGDTLTYSLRKFPAGMSIDPQTGILHWLPTQDPPRDTITVAVTDPYQGVDLVTFVLYVGNRNNQPPRIVSTPDTTTILNSIASQIVHTYRYTIQAEDPEGESPLEYGLRCLNCGAGGPQLDANAITWTPFRPFWFPGGAVTLEVKVTDARGAVVVQAFTVHLLPGDNAPPVFASTPNTQAVEDIEWHSSLVVFDFDNDSLNLIFDAVPPGMVFRNDSLHWTPSTPQIAVVRIGATDGIDTTWHRFDITVAARNDAPRILSSPVVAGIFGGVYRYPVSATDEENDALTFDLAIAPPGMTVSSIGQILWPIPETYSASVNVELVVSDAHGAETQQAWQIHIGPDSTPPVVTILFSKNPAKPDQAVTVTPSASDNVGVDMLTLSLNGSPISLSGGQHVFTPSDTGRIAFVAQAEDASGNVGMSSAILIVTNSDLNPPTVTLSHSPANPSTGQTVTFTVTASDDEALDASRIWVMVDGLNIMAQNGQAEFQALRPGNFTAQAVAYDSAGNSALASDAFFVDPLAGDNTPPTALINGPEEDFTVYSRTEILGTAYDANLAYYTLSYRDLNETDFTEFFRSTVNIQDAALGLVNATTMVNGDYEIRLNVYDRSGSSASHSVQVHVAGEKKIGNFSLTFQDLSIPMAGLDLGVTRTYDSRVKTRGDFGVGWKMGMRSIALHENRVPGKDWKVDHTFGIIWNYFLQEEASHTVTMTLPGGRKQEFTPKPRLLRCLSGGAGICPVAFDGVMEFKAKPGTYGRLEAMDADTFLVVGDELWDANWFDKDPDSVFFNPQVYKLTLLDGSYFIYDQNSGGIIESGDANGNKVAWESGAIRHNAGDAINFARDGEGRITGISDGAGRGFQYRYDVLGNLGEVLDAEGHATRFKYGPDHYLNEIIDARGVRATRTEYDNENRIVRQINANGDTLKMTHDLDASTETVEDFGGFAASYTYDLRGNVLSKTDHAGNTWAYAYDSVDNLLSTVMPGGVSRGSTYDSSGNELTSTNELGHVTTRTYDGQGNVLTVTDPVSRVTRFEYDGSGKLLKEIGPDISIRSERTYDGQGNMLTEKDALGNISSHTYNARGWLTSSTDALGRTMSYAHDAAGNVEVEVNAKGDSAHHFYNQNGNRVLEINALGDSVKTEYNAIGKVVKQTDALGHVTRFVYNNLGDKVQDIAADGSNVTRTYDDLGNMASTTDPVGRRTRMEYDFEKRPVKTVFNDSSFDSTVYDALGRRIRAFDANGNMTRFGYDNAGRNTSVTDALGHVTTYEYDDAGRRTAMVDALNQRTEYEYDDYDRLITTTFHDGSTKSIAYDAVGRKISETDQEGKTTGFEYDSVGNLRAVVDALSHRTEYTYDENNNRLTQKDANNHTTTMTYDALNRMISRMYPNGDQERWTYDDNGNTLGYVKGVDSTAYEYDAMNREVFRKHFNSGHEVSTSYTLDGKRDTVVDYRGISTFAYDNRGRLSREITHNGDFLEHWYDVQGNRTSLMTRFGTTGYTYDSLSRMKSVISPQGGTTRYFYNAVGNRDSTQNPNGTAMGYSYDALNRLIEVRNWGGSSLLSRYTYTLNDAGIRTAVDELDGSRVEFSYDDLYRLTGETRTGSNPNSISYTYDNVGNRLTQVKDGVTGTYTYNSRDQLTSETSTAGTVSYTYDAGGLQASKTDAAGATLYNWEGNDRLAGVSGPGGLNVQYEHDADGRRVKEATGGSVRQYLIDRLLPFGQVVAETDSLGSLGAQYTFGLERVSQERNSQTSHFLSDGQGSIRQLTDAAGVVTDTYDYTAFGELISSTGSTANDFRYVGEQFDGNSGFYYNRARWMDPTTGRFLSVDPASGKKTEPISLHRYLYANSSPMNFTDPTGRFGLSEILTAIAVYNVLQDVYATISQLYRGVKRPDDDGRLNFFEAGLWWKRGQGKELNITLSSLDLSGINVDDFFEKGEKLPFKVFNLASFKYLSSINDALVYGNITLKLGSGTSVTAFTDRYDFDIHAVSSPGTVVRNVETVGGLILHGPGQPFDINLQGTGRISE